MYGTFFSTGQALIAGVSKTGQEKVFLYKLETKNGPKLEDASRLDLSHFYRCQEYGQPFNDLSFPQIEKQLQAFKAKIYVLDGLFWAGILSSDDKCGQKAARPFVEAMEKALGEPSVMQNVVDELKTFKGAEEGSHESQDPFLRRALRALEKHDKIIKVANKRNYTRVSRLIEGLREAEVVGSELD